MANAEAGHEVSESSPLDIGLPSFVFVICPASTTSLSGLALTFARRLGHEKRMDTPTPSSPVPCRIFTTLVWLWVMAAMAAYLTQFLGYVMPVARMIRGLVS